MSKYCLPKQIAENFKKMLVSGEINPLELSNMSSGERRKFFTEFLGENNAKNVNTLFERKLLQKNRTKAMISWAKEVTGIKPEVRRDLVAKIERMAQDPKGNILDPKTEEAFLQDLASSKLGLDVTFEEAQEITRLSGEVTAAKEAAGDMKTFDSRIEYGNKLIDMYDYTATLKPPMGTADQIANVANVPRAIMATLDLSAPGRQGWGMISRKQFWKNLKPMVKSFVSEKAFREIQADIITRPNYRSMKRANLKLTSLGDKLSEREEAFMTNLLDNLPGVRGSERAYTGFLSKLRADMYDDFLRKAQLAGEDIAIGSKTTKDLAMVVNNFTGAGKMGKVDQSVPILNSLFFSPRKIAATVNMFNPVNYLNPKISKTARVEAFKNLMGMVGASSTVMGIAHMLGADIETDPRSSDFGKVKIGDTRIDVSGGNAGYLTLLSRLATNKTKSTITGITKDLGGGFGSRTRGDVAVKYLRNKLSPVASFFADWLYGTDAIGAPFEVTKAIINRLMPIIVSSTIETMKEGDTQGAIIAGIADFVGFGGNTYNASEDWNRKETKQMLELKREVGQEKFDEINEDFNEKFISTLNELQKDPDYLSMSDDEKSKEISRWKSNLKKEAIDGQKRKITVRKIEKARKKAVKEREKAEEDIRETTFKNEGGFIGNLVTYARAIGTDPLTAFNRIFTGQKIRRLDNGAIIVERMSFEDSSAVRRARGADKSVRLDHTIPLQLGGSNSEDNLKLVSKKEWEAYTVKENELGRKIRKGEINKKQAQKEIKNFKENFAVIQEVGRIKKKKGKDLIEGIKQLKKAFSDEELLDLFGEEWILKNL